MQQKLNKLATNWGTMGETRHPNSTQEQPKVVRLLQVQIIL